MGLADRRGKVSKKKVNKESKVEASPEIIGTNIDQIYQVVLEKKSISLSKLAAKFKVTPEKIEDWARVLDNQGLLELHYSMLGKPLLRIKNNAPSKKSLLKKVFGKKKKNARKKSN